ncbi:MAG: zinc ribbon domain-containing protein [Cyanobacteria bacterium REEB67]|nr:zinc ribbon domain-containing protein [Cyanobacteria bacterium REEB67]
MATALRDHEPESRRCPNCAEVIQEQAILCRFCQSGLSSQHFYPCPSCAEMVRNEASICRSCHNDLEPIRGQKHQPANASKKNSESLSFSNARQKLLTERARRIIELIYREVDTTYLLEYDTEVQEKVRARVRELVRFDPSALTMMERGLVLQMALDELFGFSVLGPLLRDRSVDEIYVHSHEHIFVRRGEQMEKVTEKFNDENHLLHCIERILHPLDAKLNSDTPTVSRQTLNGGWIFAALKPNCDENSNGAPIVILQMTPRRRP